MFSKIVSNQRIYLEMPQLIGMKIGSKMHYSSMLRMISVFLAVDFYLSRIATNSSFFGKLF